MNKERPNMGNVPFPKKMVFVFGSNLAGLHGACAARTAFHKHGADWGVGEGMTGNSYAIPTKDERIASRSLEDVQRSVDKFIQFAELHPDDMEFQVTRIGCGLAGFTDAQIAPMFAAAPKNCKFDEAWKPFVTNKEFWGTFNQ